MIIATANAIRPSSSAAAKPMNSRPCWPSAAAGLRSALSRNDPKTLPTPIAAAPTPIAAKPAPITCAEVRSISQNAFVGTLVEVDRGVEVKRGQQREDVRLDGADQQLERSHEDEEQETQDADADAHRAAV